MGTKIGNFLATIPTALTGLALAILSLGWCLEGAFEFQGMGQLSAAIIASLLLSVIILKFLFNPILLKQEISHYMIGSMVPTFTMVTMILANNINSYNHQLSVVLWGSSIFFHLLLMLIFVYFRMKNFNFMQVLPSWFIPPIGVAAAAISLTSGDSSFELLSIAKLSLIFGAIAYAILLPILFFRILFGSELADFEKPTLVIFATPASLILAGYLTIYDQPNHALVIILAMLAMSMTFYIYAIFNKLLRLPFSPAYAAFTFPLVVGATAMFKFSQYLFNNVDNVLFAQCIELLAYIELTIASLMVGYVCVCFIKYFNPVKKTVVS